MNALPAIWLQFLLCAGLIGSAGYQLSRQANVITRETGLSAGWIGLALLATVTSLPELVIGVTSVTMAQAPDVAVGNALGSCVLNLAFLVVLDFVYRREPVWRRASQGHVLAAAFGVVMLGLTLVGLLASQLLPTAGAGAGPALGLSLATPWLLVLYLVAMRTVFRYEREHPGLPPATPPAERSPPALRRALLRFALAALVVGGAGLWLPFLAVRLAAAMGWSDSFVGSLLVALVTTLPELTVTLAALRLGAIDLAIGNLLGSNLFNVAIVAIDDLAYRPGSLLADVSPIHAVTAASAIVMSGLAMIGLFLRPRSRVLRAVGWVSLGLAAVYLLNVSVLYLHGE